MGWQVTWRVTCESCQATGPADRDSRDAERAALAHGWLRGQNHGMALHLCPDCGAKPLPDWWPDATGTRFHWEQP